MKVDLSRQNPFSSYASNFAQNFTFGEDFDRWVCGAMIPVIAAGRAPDAPIRLADIGAGSCYWATRFLECLPRAILSAIDPSEDLLVRQAGEVLRAAGESIEGRVVRDCRTVQAFASASDDNCRAQPYDCIYFMQSAHYIGADEFEAVVRRLASRLEPRRGRIVIQARNMTPEWYPWVFPDEWRERVEAQLVATDMFRRADRYAVAFRGMSDVFSTVETTETETRVSVPAEAYWTRLEERWISTFMSESVIPPALHREGIDGIKRRYAKLGKTRVEWTERYAIVSADVALADA